jgi:hypothetical protein
MQCSHWMCDVDVTSSAEIPLRKQQNSYRRTL